MKDINYLIDYWLNISHHSLFRMNGNKEMFTLRDYSYALCYSTSYEASFAAFCQYISELGYESASYAFIPRIALRGKQPTSPVFSCSENYNKSYFQHYQQERLDQYDYIIERLLNGYSKTLYWMDDLKDGNLNHQQKNVLQIMRYDYQIKNG